MKIKWAFSLLLTLVILVSIPGIASAQDYPTTYIDNVTVDQSNKEATFEFHSDPAGAELVCAIYAVPLTFPPPTITFDWQPCTSPHTEANLQYGSGYFFAVKPADAPESTPYLALQPFAIDYPYAVIDTGPEPTIYDTIATFEFHSIPDNMPMLCRFQGEGSTQDSWYSCTSPQTFTGLVPGSVYTFDAKAEDQPDQQVFSWPFMIKWPEVMIDSSAPDPNSTTASFTFLSTPDNTPLECAIQYEGGGDLIWSDCTSPQVFTDLIAARHYVFAVRVKAYPDIMDFEDWWIMPPTTIIDSGPAATIYNIETTISFHSNPAVPVYQCALIKDGDLTTNLYDCTSPAEITGLTYNDSYQFIVMAKGAPPLPEYYTLLTWTVQLPTVIIDSGPAGTTYSSGATFTFHSDPAGVPLECALISLGNSPTWEACSISETYTNLTPDLPYAFLVRAKGAPDDSVIRRDFTPKKQTQAITFGPLSGKTYGDSSFTISATASSELPVSFNAAGQCTVSGNTVTITGAGSCAITANQGGDDSWSAAAPVTQSFDIAKKEASVTANNQSKIYGDANPALTATVTGQVTGDPIHYSLSTTVTSLSGVGPYPISVTLGLNPNYDITAVNGKLTVNPKAASVRADDKIKIYGTANPVLTATVAGQVVGGDPIVYTLSTTANTLSGVGDYPITIILGSNPNYYVTGITGKLVVNQKPVTVTVADKSKTYGDDNPVLTAAVAGAVPDGDEVLYSLATTAGKFSNIGDYPITVVPGDNPNYNVTANDGTLTIHPKDATVMADDKGKTYGDENPVFTASVTGQVVGGVEVAYTLSTTAENCSKTGEYPITVVPGHNPNYNVTAIPGKLTVNQKDATVTADDKIKSYGQDNPALTATVNGEVCQTTVQYKLDTTAVKLSPVGYYPITVTLGENPDYNASATDGTLTVERANLTVTPSDGEVEYSDPGPDDFTFTYAGWIEGEGPVEPYLTTAPECSTTWTPGSPAGTYPITCSGGAAPNYEFIYKEGTFTVTRENAAITYTGDTQATTAKAGAKATIRFAALVEEEQDDWLGETLGEQLVRFDVFSFGDTTDSTPLAFCTAPVVDIVNGHGNSSCELDLPAADPYQVRISLVNNDYYTAEYESIVVLVNDPGTGMAAGGGWLIDPDTGTRANFGLSTRFLKNGRVQGNSMFVYRVTTDLSTILPEAPAGVRDYNWIIKSNAMQGLNIYDCPEGEKAGCKATITGKNNIQAVDRLTGVMYSLGGNYQFQVDVSDNREPGLPASAIPDQFAIRVWSTSSGTYHMLGQTYDANGMLLAPLDISGGNIQVKDK